MKAKRIIEEKAFLRAEWPLDVSLTLGSAVRAKGIAQEIRTRLPVLAKAGLDVETRHIRLSLPDTEKRLFEAASALVEKAIGQIASLPLLPREVDDILAIAPRERLKWTKSGRLKSAGTKTVKLRGRSKAVTFHVFDPRHIEDVLDRDLASVWRDEDAQATSENRRRAAGKAARSSEGDKAAEETSVEPHETRSHKTGSPETKRPSLTGWDVFSADGLLR